MQCYDTLSPIAVRKTARGTAVALGYFDGVHLGHRSVLCAAQETARKENLEDAVFTFTLPARNASTAGCCAVSDAAAGTVAKGRAILTQTEKRRRMENCGVQHYFCPPFEAFCALTPAQFVDEILVHCLHARAVFCGGNFAFGVKKSGDVALLRTLCAARGIAVHVADMAQYAGETVSSSRVRTALEQGDITAVNAMLGEPYRIDFSVQAGKKLGRTLGFPTINQIYPPTMMRPKEGVYLTRTRVEYAQGARWLPSATGLGTRPTVTGGTPDAGVTCETFIVDYSGTLYGACVSVEFCTYWQPTQRFDTLDALKAYVARAAEAARALEASASMSPRTPDTKHEEAVP